MSHKKFLSTTSSFDHVNIYEFADTRLAVSYDKRLQFRFKMFIQMA